MVQILGFLRLIARKAASELLKILPPRGLSFIFSYRSVDFKFSLTGFIFSPSFSALCMYVFVCACLTDRLSVSVWVCVPIRDREVEDTDGDTQRETHTQRERDRQCCIAGSHDSR